MYTNILCLVFEQWHECGASMYFEILNTESEKLALDEIHAVECCPTGHDPTFVAVGALRAHDVAVSLVMVCLLLAPRIVTKIEVE